MFEKEAATIISQRTPKICVARIVRNQMRTSKDLSILDDSWRPSSLYLEAPWLALLSANRLTLRSYVDVYTLDLHGSSDWIPALLAKHRRGIPWKPEVRDGAREEHQGEIWVPLNIWPVGTQLERWVQVQDINIKSMYLQYKKNIDI